MSLIGRLFGTARAPQGSPASRPPSQLASGYTQQHSVGPLGSQNATRRELLRVVLRDTMNRHGIPAAWLQAEMLVATSRNREPGIHWRLTVRHWDPRLMTHAVAFQQSLIRRIMAFDPMANTWLMGISWQFALPDESVCPPMPHPASWTARADEPDTSPTPLPAAAGGAGDVIAGPVRIPESDEAAEARADLERLMALRDADFRQHATAGAGDDDEARNAFPATEPAKL